LTNSKHISHDPYSLLLCDVTAHVQDDGHVGNKSCDSYMLLCDIIVCVLHSNDLSADIESTVPVLLAECVLRALPSNS
jgi:hypothetical protein